MSWYVVLKHLHVFTAVVTSLLFSTRLILDACHRPGWRTTPLKWLPHVNDTLLFVAAIGLVITTGWMPFVHHWLTAKVLLLVGYVLAGSVAIKPTFSPRMRAVAALVAFLQLGLIFWLATNKPLL